VNLKNPDTPTEIEARALAFMFAGFSERSLRYAVLRNYESLPQSVGARDIDILVHPDDLPAAIEVIAALADELGASFAKAFRDDMIVQLILMRRLETNALFQIKIDLLHNRQVYGVECLNAEQMLTQLQFHNGLPVVKDCIRFLDKWLFNRFVGQPTDPKYDADFALICRTERAAIMTLLTPLIGNNQAASELDEIARGRASSMDPLTRFTRLKLLVRIAARSGLKSANRLGRFAYYRAINILAPQGVFLSLSGPDGSGKTTVIGHVIEELEEIFGKDAVVYGHFRPTMLPRIAEVALTTGAVKTVDTDYERPHRSQPSGFAGSLTRIVYYGLDYLVGFLRRIHPNLVKRKIVLYDRYYYDMIADPFRSRISLPLPILRTVGRLLPLPHHAFYIQVAPEEIRRRKQELTLDRIIELNARYKNLAQRGWMTLIDNNGTAEVAAAAIIDHIVTLQDRKARKHLHVPNKNYE
jgi:thymidylate kinase